MAIMTPVGKTVGRIRRPVAGTIGRHQILVVIAVERRAADIFDLHLGRAGVGIVQHLGGALRQVDQAAVRIRPAIVDAHDDRTAVLDIGDARIARQRHRRMRRGQMRHVVDFAIGGQPAVEGVAIPGGGADLLVVLVFLRIVRSCRAPCRACRAGRGRRRARRFDFLVVTRGLAFTPYSASEKYSLERFLTFTIAFGCDEAQAARNPAATVSVMMVVALRRRERAGINIFKIVP